MGEKEQVDNNFVKYIYRSIQLKCTREKKLSLTRLQYQIYVLYFYIFSLLRQYLRTPHMTPVVSSRIIKYDKIHANTRDITTLLRAKVTTKNPFYVSCISYARRVKARRNSARNVWLVASREAIAKRNFRFS